MKPEQRHVLPDPWQGAGPLVSLEGAGVRFGATRALRAVSFEVRRGDRLMLIGANGSGKTTLLRLLHGLIRPTEGQRRLHPLSPEDRMPVGAMLFQRPFLLRLSVLRNLQLALWLNGVPAPERAHRCTEALERVGLAGMARRGARDLSGGQQQRLALARAWALRPDILFLDEPTASLDPGAKREVEALVERIAQDGVTLVMSTHNLGQAKRLGSRIAYVEGGRVEVDLPVDRFFGGELPPAATQFLRGELPWG
jgi:tungstate transport system ATP-binding protein